MDRLRELSIVTLSLPDSARVGEFKAYVVGVHRRVATLQPVARVDTMWLPDGVEDVLMTFVHGLQTVGLRGDLRVGERTDDVRFRVSDGVYVPRRRSSRLRLCAPVSLTPIGGGTEIVCQAQDIGPDGVMLEGAVGLEPNQIVDLSVMLPEHPEPVCAEAIVTTVDDNSLCSLEFLSMERTTRRRLSGFVTEHLKRRLRIIRSLREGEDDDWD